MQRAVSFSSAYRPKVLPPSPTADTFSPDRPSRLYRIDDYSNLSSIFSSPEA